MQLAFDHLHCSPHLDSHPYHCLHLRVVSQEFINRNGEFTVNIGLCENNKPVAGIVYCPALGKPNASYVHPFVQDR